MSDETKLVNSAVEGGKALASLSKREMRMAALLALGTLLAKHSDQIAAIVSLPELSPVIFKVALVALGLGFSRLLLRIYFKYLDLSELVEVAKREPMPAAIVAAACIYLIAQMFSLVVVR